MLKIRTFNENPLLSEIRYELGKSLSTKVFFKKDGEFIKLNKSILNKMKIIDDTFYYGLFIEHNSEDIIQKKSFSNIAFDGEYINMFNYISLMITREKLDLEFNYLNFIQKEMYDYLEYRETIQSLISYYKLAESKDQSVLIDKNEIK